MTKKFPTQCKCQCKTVPKLLNTTCHPNSEKQCHDPTLKVHKSLSYGNCCSPVHMYFFTVSLNCTNSKVFLGPKMSWTECDIPHLPDSVRIASQLHMVLINSKMPCFLLLPDHTRKWVLLFSALYLYCTSDPLPKTWIDIPTDTLTFTRQYLFLHYYFSRYPAIILWLRT